MIISHILFIFNCFFWKFRQKNKKSDISFVINAKKSATHSFIIRNRYHRLLRNCAPFL